MLKATIVRSLVLFITPFLWAQCCRADHSMNNQCETLTVRKEWRTLSKEQRTKWISSIKCLHNIRHQRLSLAHQGSFLTDVHPSLFDDFSYAHAEMDKSAHVTPYFLPWHRWILWMFEMRLRDTCGYTGPMPYWDWSLDTADLLQAPVFDPDPEYGLGGSGDCDSTPASDCNVQDGALSLASQTPVMLSFPVPHILRRNLSLYDWQHGRFEHPRNVTLTRFQVHHIQKQTTPGDYFMFQHLMTKIHNQVHNFVGGDLMGQCPKEMETNDCGSFTSNDPLFWLHHGQVDRIWVNWQNMHPDNFKAFGGWPLHPESHPNSTNWKDYTPDVSAEHLLKFDRLSASIPVSAVFNTTAPPFCYVYDDAYARL